MVSPTSRSSSVEAVETVQIFVKNVSGDSKRPFAPSSFALLTGLSAVAMTVPQDLSISNLAALLSLRTSLPTDSIRLVYAGKHLDSSSTLAENHIQRESTIHLAMPLRGGAPKKLRCTQKDCREVAQRIIGDCGFCQGHFCGKHRLLEDHKCTGLEDVSFPSSSTSTDKSPQWWLVGLDAELLADMMT
jgi:hypothetical protein